MSAFKVGEVAIFQNAEVRHDLNGSEVVIEIAGVHCFSGVTLTQYIGYGCVFPCGLRANVAPHQLRKRRPPSTDESHQAMLDCIERAKRGQGVEA